METTNKLIISILIIACILISKHLLFINIKIKKGENEYIFSLLPIADLFFTIFLNFQSHNHGEDRPNHFEFHFQNLPIILRIFPIVDRFGINRLHCLQVKLNGVPTPSWNGGELRSLILLSIK